MQINGYMMNDDIGTNDNVNGQQFMDIRKMKKN